MRRRDGFMKIRTDLALEMRAEAMDMEADRDRGEIDGILFSERNDGSIGISTIDIVNDNGSKKLMKPRGKYITISFGDVSTMTYDNYERLCLALSDQILMLAHSLCKSIESILVCGLGNENFSADSVGTSCVSRIVVTRHLKRSDPDIIQKAGFFDVCAISPGVTAQTGFETLETVKNAVDCAKPDLVIVVDSLAARETKRLASTIQLSDTGITPGSGIGNHRSALCRSTLGVPTVSIGVPMIIDSRTLISDALREAGAGADSSLLLPMFVCPKDVDVSARLLGNLIAYAINTAFHKNMTIPEMMIM